MATPMERYLTSRGLRETNPQVLNRFLAAALDRMEPLAYDDAASGLPVAEQAALRAGGLELEPTTGPDPLAMTVAKYAAIIQRSLTTKEVSGRLDVAGSRIRQLISDRSLYSFLVDGKRRIPEFQFLPGGALVPNIPGVNRALSPRLHPVEVFNWLHGQNTDLVLDENLDIAVSPLDWLKAGHDAGLVALLARRL